MPVKRKSVYSVGRVKYRVKRKSCALQRKGPSSYYYINAQGVRVPKSMFNRVVTCNMGHVHAKNAARKKTVKRKRKVKRKTR